VFIIYQGDVLKALKLIPDESVDCIITSPPYYGQRFYGEETNVIWDGKPGCNHEFVLNKIKDPMDRGGSGDKEKKTGKES